MFMALDPWTEDHVAAASLASACEKQAISKKDCYQATSQHGKNEVKGI